MLNALPTIILLDVVIFFTARSWGLSFYIVDKKLYIFESAAIGCFVCLLGYSVQLLGAPIWAVVAAPIAAPNKSLMLGAAVARANADDATSPP